MITIIGATGNVGRKTVEILMQLGYHELQLLASKDALLTLGEKTFPVYKAEPHRFAGQKICIFNTESDVSSELIPHALKAGCYVVDSSSHYRLSPDVPLIVPPVNRALVSPEHKLYAHANCLVSPIATALAPLHKRWGVRYASVATYQSTSGAGKAAMDECWFETQHVIQGTPYQRKCFQRPIAFNVIPQVGSLREDGYTGEEYKIIHETRKVLGQKINLSVTSVRVPVLIGHSMAIDLQLWDDVCIEALKQEWGKADNVTVSQDYHTPVEVEGSDQVFVGRIRKNPFQDNGYQVWLCSDNLRRGAATDGVEIALEIIKHCLPTI